MRDNLEQILGAIDPAIKRVAIIGMAKNCGKTVTLNRLIAESTKHGLHLGLTSTGRDGEREDVVWHNAKPPVWVPPGTVLATVKEAIDQATAQIQIIENTGCITPLGAVYLTRTLTAGYVQLAGPSKRRELQAISRQLQAFGAELVLIDGALDRKVSASPQVTDGLILATGAILAPHPEQVLQGTCMLLEQLRIPAVGEQLGAMLQEQGEVVAFTNSGEIIATGLRSALGKKSELNLLLKTREDICGISLPGALTEETLGAVAQRLNLLGKFTLVIEDGSKIFVPPLAWRKYREQGGEVQVLQTINVLALTINPYSPTGWKFEPQEFLQLARSRCTDLPIYDPCQLPVI